MKSVKPLFLLGLGWLGLAASFAQTLRPPAYPLTHDPYLSLWSFRDTLSAAPTRHRTGEAQPLEGVVRVDGKAYQLLGQAAAQFRAIILIAAEGPYPAHYTFEAPAAGWEKPAFAAAATWPATPTSRPRPSWALPATGKWPGSSATRKPPTSTPPWPATTPGAG